MTQPLLKQNVVMLQRRNRDNRSVGEEIYKFLGRHNIGNDLKLEGTAAEYERDIKRFFKSLIGKDINQLTVQDLDLLPMHIEEFQLFMVRSGYKSNTVNRNIDSVRALYGFFASNRYRYQDESGEWIYILQSIFNDIDKVDLNDVDPYGTFTHNEVQQIIALAKKSENGIRKSLAIELASVTSFRLEAIVSLNIKEDFRRENGVWVAKTIDKKKPHEKAIREDLYDRMKNLSDPSGKVFNFTIRTLQRAVESIIEEMELDEDRNLTFHSLKKYGIEEVYHITNGDSKAMADQGNHASYETTQKYYTAFEKDFSKMPCLFIGQDIDTSKIQDLSKDQLVQLIFSASRSTQYELLHLVNKTLR